MPATPHGRHCASCQREVVDFRQATAADLAWARLAASDGRPCGLFRPGQLAVASRPAARLGPRLRLFLVALVLVLGQGLSAQQAWAQVRQGSRHAVPPPPPPPGGIAPPPARQATFERRPLYTFADQMPVYQDGGIEGLRRALARQVQRPAGLGKVAGEVFVGFVVDREGRIRQPRVVRGLHPQADAQALRLVERLGRFAPGRQQGQPVDVEYTVPVVFPSPR